jgi:signal transduction histidine kinase
VDADEARLMQVLTNLLSNAVKFSPKGARIDLAVDQHGGRVRLRVRDYGPGIPPEFAGRIFGKFQQAEGSRKTSAAGTGLGLAISRAIIEMHGGAIGWRNRAPGAEFWFELDVAEGADASEEATHGGA